MKIVLSFSEDVESVVVASLGAWARNQLQPDTRLRCDSKLGKKDQRRFTSRGAIDLETEINEWKRRRRTLTPEENESFGIRRGFWPLFRQLFIPDNNRSVREKA